MSVYPGYWRDTSQNDNIAIHKCTQGENHCLGGVESKCEEGYTGPLCESCNMNPLNGAKYRPFLKNTCKSCEFQTFEGTLIDFVALVFPLILLFFSIKFLITPTEERAIHNSQKSFDKTFIFSLRTHLMINLLQHLFILQALGFITLPHLVAYLVEIITNHSFLIFGHLTCLITNITLINLVCCYFLIIFIKFVLVIGFTRLSSQNSLNITQPRIFFAVVWLFFLEIPGFIHFLTEVFECHQIDDWRYSKFNLELECSNKTFQEFKAHLLAPILILTILIFPLFITYQFTRIKRQDLAFRGYQNLKLLIFAKAENFIAKSDRNWLYFYYTAFGKLFLLLLPNGHVAGISHYMLLLLYFVSLVVFNQPRKVLYLQDWKRNILMINSLIFLFCLILGWTKLIISGEGLLIKSVEVIFWIFIGVYLIKINVIDIYTQEKIQFVKLHDNVDEF